MSFEDSKTYQNLKKAFEGETKASGKYAIYARKAREDGYQQIGNIFEETSGNEREHAEIWLKLLNGGELPPTLENLKAASDGEHYEWTEMYPQFADTARQEGYLEIADLFEGVAKIENHHGSRFGKLARNIEHGMVFCKNREVVWVCLNCGNLIWGECAPEVCPVCAYPRGYYELNCDNFQFFNLVMMPDKRFVDKKRFLIV